MSLVLNTNIASLNAQNSLTGSQAQLSQSLQRLSSGLRINSASDDAAGLAISQQFTTQINGTNQAVRNANDAVSEAQTTAGALNTIVNNLQSIRTLAVQSANGSNSASDRAALNNQVQQQIAEITQIAQQTTFNGLNVLNGSSGTTVYQVGANVGNTIAVSLQQGVAANQVGQFSTQTGTAVTAGTLSGTNTVTISDGTSSVTVGPTASFVGATIYQGASSAYAKAGAINGGGLQGLTASAANSQIDNTAFATISGGTNGTGAGNTGATASSYSLSINGVAIFSGSGNVGVGQTLTGAQVAAQVNLFSGQTGVTASINTSTANGGVVGALTLSNSDGSDIVTTQSVTLGVAGGGTGAAAGLGTGLGTTLAVGGAGSTLTGKVTLTDSKPVTITDIGAGGGSAALGFTTGVATGLSQTASGATATLANQNVLTVAGANSTISSVDAALATVSAFQSQLGAIQNRFTSAVGNLQSTAQNLTQSRSTIQDADFAAETANLTQAQVLEQAGISVLAQANQQPQLILKLLQ
ncbi:MAG: flagellin [Gammaproteobacteria bacterium]|jgi:flagellin|nr:flagellin [Gammaproteobacteria bacterium]